MIKLLEIANSIDQQQVDEGFKEKALAAAMAAGMAYGGYKKYTPQYTPQKPETIQTQAASPKKVNIKDLFRQATDNVIKNIEGGYINPKTLKNRAEQSVFSKSGETMFGIDRETGGKKNKTAAGKQFWRLIDQNKRTNPEKWKRYYDGGEIKDELKDLATQMMETEFARLFKNTLSPEAQKIVESDPRLFFHFVYAAWNGSGHFNNFAKALNRRVKEGTTNTDKLFDLSIQDRISKGGIIKDKADKVKQTAENFF